MRYSISKAIGIGILSILFLGSNGNPVTSDLACGDNCNKPSWTLAKGIHSPPPYILPRAGGGVRPGKPNDRGPDGAPLDRPNDPNNPSVPTNQNGEEGGFQGQPETGGGFNNICTRKTRWPIQWRRSGCGNPQQPPTRASVRNNNNQPATQGERANPSRDINIQERRDEFRSEIQQNYQNRPWFFFSGVSADDASKWKNAVDLKLRLPDDRKTGFIQDFVTTTNPHNQRYVQEYNTYNAEGFGSYFWAANSKAFAQAVEGKVYALIPGDRAINQPYDGQGSNWWSYELPELTRNPNIESITVIRADVRIDLDNVSQRPKTDVPLEFDGPNELVWTRGDEPIGFPGDEHFEYARPQWPLHL
jgi:hypothetical protein